MKNDLPNKTTVNELEKVQESLKVTRKEKKKQTLWAEKDKQEITKHAATSGVTKAIRKIQPNFSQLNQKYCASMGKKPKKNPYRSRRRRREKPVSNQQLEELEIDHCL